MVLTHVVPTHTEIHCLTWELWPCGATEHLEPSGAALRFSISAKHTLGPEDKDQKPSEYLMSNSHVGIVA